MEPVFHIIVFPSRGAQVMYTRRHYTSSNKLAQNTTKLIQKIKNNARRLHMGKILTHSAQASFVVIPAMFGR